MPNINRKKSARKNTLSLPLILLLLLAGACTTGKDAKKVTPPLPPPKGELKTITVEPVEGNIRVAIESTAAIQYTAFKLKDPLRLVLDLNNTDAGPFKDPIKVDQGVISTIKIQNFSKSGSTRVEILITGPVTHEIVRPAHNILHLLIPDNSGVVEKTQEKQEEKALPEKLLHIKNVEFIKVPGDKSRIIVQTAGGTPKFTLFKRDDLNQLILDIENATVSPDAQKEMTITEPSTVIRKIRSFQHTIGDSPGARVVVDMAAPITYKVYRDRGDLLIDIARAEAAVTPAPESTSSPQPKKAETKTPEAGEEKTKKGISSKTVSMDLQNADVINILKLIADVSDMNIITGGQVSGKITMRLINVPWEKALDVILKTAKLGMIRDGNIIRIAPLSAIIAEKKAAAQEKTARADMKVAEEKLEELVTEIISINYATASEMLTNLTRLKSERGDISIDARTNSLIILDTKKKIAKMKYLIEQLDKRTPQVLIEARIVEVNRNYAKDLGIEWGGSMSKTTNSSFPSTVGVAGSSVGTNIVSLPAGAGDGVGGAISATLGSVAGTVALDLRISALEAEGKARILSSPKIVTSDNQTATIESGKSIPYATASASGTSVQFVNATIGLTVTPHITSDGYVSLQISATKNEADFGNQVQGTPSIITKSATTQVLIKDGETTVIGGLYKTTTSESTAGVPWLRKIPIIKWFFSKRNESEIGEELLIFITATIMK